MMLSVYMAFGPTIDMKVPLVCHSERSEESASSSVQKQILRSAQDDMAKALFRSLLGSELLYQAVPSFVSVCMLGTCWVSVC